jgi:hypothetical protein
MSALMTPRPARRRRTRQAPAPGGQPALFGAGAPVVAPERPAAAPVEPATAAAATVSPETAEAARAHRHGPTLDDLVAGAWESLLAGAPADCVVCGSALAPRHSAGAGVVGGRCGDCGTTVS